MSESIEKIGNIGIRSAYSGPPINGKKAERKSLVEFLIRLCGDVLLEVLRWGNRYHLAELEKNGRRFHWFIDRYFKEAPFLRLNLELIPRHRILISGKISRKEISEKKFKAAEIPPYLRFDIKLSYMDSCGCTIGEKFEWVQMILQSYQALTGSKFEFLGKICNLYGDGKKVFKDSSTLLDQIDKLLQIFARCRSYKFYIESHIDENTSAHVLPTILQFDAIVRCSKIEVEFNFGSYVTIQTRLPIEAIENWLNRTNADGKALSVRFLKLEIHQDVSNLSEMFEHLKENFQAAKVAAQPFTLRIRFDIFLAGFEMVEEQLITNKKTNEELSLTIIDNGYEKENMYIGAWTAGCVIEIKRKRIVSKAVKKCEITS